MKEQEKYMEKLVRKAAERVTNKIQKLGWEFAELLGFLADVEKGFMEMRVKPKKSGGYLIILKRLNVEGVREVTFGSADDPLAAFIAIEDVLMKANWREDKEWVQPPLPM